MFTKSIDSSASPTLASSAVSAMAKTLAVLALAFAFMMAIAPEAAMADDLVAGSGDQLAVTPCEHEWGDWEVVTPATIKAPGSESRACLICGTTEPGVIEKLTPFARLTSKSATLKVGKTKKLKVTFAKGDKVKSWKSNKTKVATVTKSGKVKARKVGTAKITVKLASGKKATCKIKVKKAAKKKSKAAAASASGGTVYWTPSGKVYHKSRSCSTLSRSRTVYSGTISQSHKPRACKVCS